MINWRLEYNAFYFCIPYYSNSRVKFLKNTSKFEKSTIIFSLGNVILADKAIIMLLTPKIMIQIP
jgi:uridine kinase